MKKTSLILLVVVLLGNGCNKSKNPFKVKLQETAFTFNYKSPYYDDKGVQLDSTLFKDTTFKDLKKGRVFSLAKIKLTNTNLTLLIKETPKRKHLDNSFFLMNFDENNNPIDYQYIYRHGLDIDRVEITKDTIFKHINYGGSAWVEKIIINKNGEFVHLGDERIWIKPEKRIKRTYEEMMRDMP